MTDAAARFAAAFAACPIVAVLRGVSPSEIDAIGDVLVEAGIRILEVPLNSPDPFESIERLARRHGEHALVGAGTVLDTGKVAQVAAAGGKLVVSPDTNPAVIAATVAADMVSLPGFFTPSEAFAALAAGAHGLKLFPAEGSSPAALKAMRAVLPKDAAVLAVGGITPETMAPWRAVGADGFGLGSNLYRAGKSAADTAADAARFVAAVRAL